MPDKELWPGTRLPTNEELEDRMFYPYKNLVDYLESLAEKRDYYFMLFREAGWIIPQLLQDDRGLNEFYAQWCSLIVDSLKKAFASQHRNETIRELETRGYVVEKMHVLGLDSCEWWVIYGHHILMPVEPVEPQLSDFAKDQQVRRKFDAVEVHPMVQLPGGSLEPTEHSDPKIHSWSVFLHLKKGGRESVANCPTEEMANTVADALEGHYRLPNKTYRY